MSILSKCSCSNLNSTRQNSPFDMCADLNHKNSSNNEHEVEDYDDDDLNNDDGSTFMFRPIRRDEFECELDSAESAAEEADLSFLQLKNNTTASTEPNKSINNNNDKSGSHSSGSTPSSDIWILPTRRADTSTLDDSLNLNHDPDGT